MTKPTPMEKMEEIVRALERLAAYRVAWNSTMGSEEREHMDDINVPRALTLARELRDSAVAVMAWDNNPGWMAEQPLDDDDPSQYHARVTPALLILSDPTSP